MRASVIFGLGIIALLVSVGSIFITRNGVDGAMMKAPVSDNIRQCAFQIGTMGIPADNKCFCLNVVVDSELQRWTCTGAPTL